MKTTLGFSIIWTVGWTIGVIAMWRGDEFSDHPTVRVILSLASIFGLSCIRWSWRRYKRYQSVTVVGTGEGQIFVWTEIDGSEHSSATDPRIQWDEEDRLDDK